MGNKKHIIMKTKYSINGINFRLGMIKEQTSKLEQITKECMERTKNFKGKRPFKKNTKYPFGG